MALVLCEQRQALLRTDGSILVRGGAGSGKTTIALAKACADLQAHRLAPDGKALFLSFARATVARVAERATATIPRALMSRIEINTYHGFAWTVLRSHGYLLCAKPGVSLLLPAQARSHLAGTEGDARVALQRQLFEREGLIAFDLFPTLLTELFEQAQRIYDFKGADPRRFDEFIAAFNPTPFDFRGENNRSAGTAITNFADDLITGEFTTGDYTGVTILRYRGRSLRPLKQEVLRMVARLRRNPEWSLAILVPANALAVNVFDYMAAADHGLPSYPVDIVVAAEGPMLAANLIALLMEPEGDWNERAASVLHGLAAFELGRIEEASDTSIRRAARYRALAAATRARGVAALGGRGIGPGVRALVDGVSAVSLTGDPLADWRTIRALFNASDRDELVAIGKEAAYAPSSAWRSNRIAFVGSVANTRRLPKRARASCCRSYRGPICGANSITSRRYRHDDSQSQGEGI